MLDGYGIPECHTSETIPPKYAPPNELGVISPLVSRRQAIANFIQSNEELFFFSVNLPAQKIFRTYGHNVEYSTLSLLQQYRMIKFAMLNADWEQYRDVYTEYTNRVGKKHIRIIEEKLYYPIFEEAMFFFETTKTANMHFHMIVKCDLLTCTEIKNRLARIFDLKTKTQIAIDFRPVHTDRTGMLEYIYKDDNPDGTRHPKSYERVDWQRFTPMWIINKVSPETIALQKQYLEYQEEVLEREREFMWQEERQYV
jgi:hypothetical protein